MTNASMTSASVTSTASTDDVMWGDLIAIRVSLPSGPSIDPWSLAGGTGRLIAAPERIVVGIGTARQIDLPGGLADVGGLDALVDMIATLPCNDHLGPDAGCGHPVIAFGALPFDRTAPSALAVCSHTYGREADGTEWVTVVASPDEAATATSDPDRLRAALASRAAKHLPPSVFADDAGAPRAARAMSDDDFRSAVSTAVDVIDGGSITKVVVARHVDVFPVAPLDEAALLTRWRDMEPGCTLVALDTPEGRFLGASPELLVSRQGLHVASTPLAGTTDRHHDACSVLPSTLLESTKDGNEHRLVVDAIVDALRPTTTLLKVPDGPTVVHLRTISHLATPISGTLSADPTGRVPSALHLAALLHPTPAVAGVPRDAALALIDRLEAAPRGPYAGPVGYVDGSGDGRWMVGIRAVLIDGRRVRLTAGVGVVAGSQPETELAEVGLKLRSVLDALDVEDNADGDVDVVPTTQLATLNADHQVDHQRDARWHSVASR